MASKPNWRGRKNLRWSSLEQESMRPDDLAALRAFQTKLARLQRSANGAMAAATALTTNLEPSSEPSNKRRRWTRNGKGQVRELEKRTREILVRLAWRFDSPGPQRKHARFHSGTHRPRGRQRTFSLSRPSHSDEESYDIAHEELGVQVEKIRTLLEKEIKPLEKALDDAGPPWTPGRLPIIPKSD